MARSKKRFVGDVGEEVAVRYLKSKGFSIIERNYLKKWGEIDIIVKKSDVLHFVEVKTIRTGVSRETAPLGSEASKWVKDEYRPEENVDERKLKRIQRAVETYLLDRKVSRETPWQIDVIAVRLDLENKEAKVGILENIIDDSRRR